MVKGVSSHVSARPTHRSVISLSSSMLRDLGALNGARPSVMPAGGGAPSVRITSARVWRVLSLLWVHAWGGVVGQGGGAPLSPADAPESKQETGEMALSARTR